MRKKIAAVLTTALISGGSSFALEDIARTVHNLAMYPGDTTEICVFCHTPHGANSDLPQAPLWNKPANSSGVTPISGLVTYQLYGGGQTMVGGTPVNQPGDVSRACLSCHDGVSSVTMVLNAPGSGNYDPVNGVFLRYRSSTNWRMPYPFAVGKGWGGFTSYDLSDDHPVGVVYRDANDMAPGVPPPASLKLKTTPLPSYFKSGDTNRDGTVNIADLLRGGKVECVSCHDPHFNTGRFLRTADGNANSSVCMVCHEK